MDIKPQNFIFVNGLLKVIDLGCAELVDEGEEFTLCESSKGQMDTWPQSALS